VIEDTIARIEDRLRSTESLPADQRQELEQLLRQLRIEARSLPNRPSASAPEPADESEDVQSAVDRLQESLTEFETTHPQLVGLVNRISTVLSNMGI
jgi:hypothetical protein